MVRRSRSGGLPTVELCEDRLSVESIIVRFRHLLEAHGSTALMSLDRSTALLVTTATIVAEKLLAAPSAKEDATKTQNREMR